jgi:hypothetical protein
VNIERAGVDLEAYQQSLYELRQRVFICFDEVAFFTDQDFQKIKQAGGKKFENKNR